MNIKIKRVMRCVGFLLCTVLVMLPLLKCFGYPAMDNGSRSGKLRYMQFYKEKENTISGILIGASNVHREWVAPVAYEEYGITMYALSSSNQSLSLAVPILREAQTRQDIDYAVVDLRTIRMKSLGKRETAIRHCLDNMPLSINRCRAVRQILEYNELYNSLVPEKKQRDFDALSLYFPFLKYHTRWSAGLTEEDFGIAPMDMKSVSDDELGFAVKSMEPFDTSYDEDTALNELQTRVLDDLLAYAENEGIRLIFISSPAVLSKGGHSEIQAAQRYVSDRGYDVLDMMNQKSFQEIGLDFDEDYGDPNHLNLKGGLKFTRFFSEYLKDNYDIPDMRGQKSCKSWEEAAANFWKFYNAGWEAAETS